MLGSLVACDLLLDGLGVLVLLEGHFVLDWFDLLGELGEFVFVLRLQVAQLPVFFREAVELLPFLHEVLLQLLQGAVEFLNLV